MKKNCLLAAVVLLLVTNTVSILGWLRSSQQQQRDYVAACRMSDIIRHYMDELRDSASIVEDYGAFDEICGIYLYDDAIANPAVKLENYVFCY